MKILAKKIEIDIANHKCHSALAFHNSHSVPANQNRHFNCTAKNNNVSF
jgi:hypothetical protein